MTKLQPEFYLRDDVVEISIALLGKILVTNIDGKITAGRIVETEAYNGRTDKASHAYGDLRTKRTDVMYREGGRAYVYLCYGVHHLFNVVTTKEGKADAVLIRAVEPLEGEETMLHRRKQKKLINSVTSGPGKLSMALGIHYRYTNESLLNNLIWIEEAPKVQKKLIIADKRIGVDYAEEASDFRWRFYIKDNPYISK
jgi:DNA-3-methyladenine glycosylase